MVSDICYRTTQIVRGNPLLQHGLLFSISSKGSFICTIPDRITHIMAFVTPVVEHWLEREIVQRLTMKFLWCLCHCLFFVMQLTLFTFISMIIIKKQLCVFIYLFAHWAISRSRQCSTTGVTKVVVCVILSVGWCI